MRRAASSDGSVNLLTGERIMSATGDERAGFVVWITGTGPVPADPATIAARPPLPPLAANLPDIPGAMITFTGPPSKMPPFK